MNQARWTISAVLLGSAVALSTTPAFAASFKVAPSGQDYTNIQAAVDAASDGDSIIVYPGTYQGVGAGVAAVDVTKSLKLKAKIKKSDPLSQVIIVPDPGQQHGIHVHGTDLVHVDGLQIKNFTIQGFPKMGIYLQYVDNFKIDGNTSIDNLENGIWPTLSAHGQVKKNVSYGSDDSALWIEASTDVRVLSNTLYDSVTGLEVTISEDVEMSKNIVYNNTVGVGLYHPNGAGMESPPGLVSGGWVLKQNHIYDNNRENTAPPASLAGALPPGGGILVLGVDGVQGDSNLIEDNDFYGISIIDYCAAVDGGASDCDLIPAIVEGHPELNKFAKTEFVNNGTAPAGSCSVSGDMCLVDADCVMSGGGTCDAHPLAAYAADVTFIGTDIFDPDPTPPYAPNTICGSGVFTNAQLGAGLIILPKC